MEDLLHAFDCGHFRFVQRPEVLHEGNVVLHLLHVAHAGEHHQHAGEARGKAQGVACRAAAVQRVQYGLRVLGQPDKIAALDRLHDDDGLVIFPADLIAGAALDSEIVVVRVVEPDLDGFDLRIVRQDLLEHLRAVMERAAHMADLALGLEGKGRLIGAAGLEMQIVARALRVHQVEVKILDAAGLELLLKQRADVRLGLEEVRRQLVGQDIAVAGIAAGEAGLQRGLALALQIAVGGIEVVEARVQKRVHHAACLREVDLAVCIGSRMQPKPKFFLTLSMSDTPFVF